MTPEQALSALDQALRDALEVVGPERILHVVRERTGPDGFSRLGAEARQRRAESLGDLLAEMDEVYGPVPHELLDWAERQWPDYVEE